MKDILKNPLSECDTPQSGLNAEFPEKAPANAMREVENLRSELRKIAGERDKLTDELEKIRFRKRIGEVATSHRFTDPDYLEFLCRQREISPDDLDGVESMMEELKSQSPKLFRMEIQPGLPRRVEPADKETIPHVRYSRSADELMQMLQDAPDLN